MNRRIPSARSLQATLATAFALATAALSALAPSTAHAQKSIDYLENSKAWGHVVADFDRDGHQDLFITGHDSDDRIWYWSPVGYRPGNQVFPWRDRHDCAAADVNGDGRLDLYCAIGAVSGTGLKRNELWLQQPSGLFVEAQDFGAEDPSGRARHPVFLDVDHDGHPDIYIANDAGARSDGLPNINHLYLNRQGGTQFVEAVGAATGDRGFACAVAGDIDGDGWDDLVLCNSKGHGHLYVNNHLNDFVDITESPALGSTWRDAKLVDMNGDGRQDLVVVTADNRVQVWLNTGSRPYFAVVPTWQLTMPARGMAITVGDFDGDGRKDIYVVLADSACAAAGPDLAGDVMLWGGAGATWTKAQFAQNFGGCGHGAATVDGNQVLLENGTPGLRGPNYVLGFGAR